MSSPKDFEPHNTSPFTKLPNGEWIQIGQVAEYMRKSGEAEITTAPLISGDIVMMYQPEVKFINFQIESAEINDLGISGGSCPAPRLIGKLSGDIPDDLNNNNQVVFAGSGFGGSMRQPGLIATGRIPYFFVPGEGEIRGNLIQNFDILRKNEEGKYKVVEPTQLDADSKKEIAVHAKRLEKITQLMQVLGFDKLDFMDGTKSWPTLNLRSINEEFTEEDWPLVYEDEQYKAQYVAGMAMGNQLAIFDKKSNMWVEFKYFNYQNDDVLQIGVADITNAETTWLIEGMEDYTFTDQILNYVTSESTIHASGVPIITFSTSGRYGINAVNYHLGDKQRKELEETLGAELKLSPTPMSVMPDIQIWPGNEIRIAGSFLDNFENDHPGSKQRIASSVEYDGSKLQLMNRDIILPNPDQMIDSFLEYFRNRK